MATINPFPGGRIRNYLAGARDCQKFQLGLFSAQRAVVLAEDAVSRLLGVDSRTVDSALEACWNSATTGDFEQLGQHASLLRDRLFPESGDTYSFDNSVSNDAISSIIYTIGSVTSNDTESSYHAAESLFNLADLLLNRNCSHYVTDLASAPITALAARCISADLDLLEASDDFHELNDIRVQLIAEGYELSSLAD